jgi:membrane protein DedA with SNARE-associated domain
MELLQKYGYSLVFITIFLEQLGLPIPAAPVIILAGALSASGMLSLPVALLCAAIGCLSGDLIWYSIGRKKGRGVLKTLCRLSLNPDSCVRKTEGSFLRYGMNSLLFAKFFPGLNSLAQPMAGMIRSGFFSFLWRDLIGTFLYCTTWLLLGFFFEKQVFEITAVLEEVGRSLIWLILAIIAIYVLFKFLRLKYLQRVLYKERISPQELFERIQAGEMLTLIDLRSSLQEMNQKLPGALQFLPDDIDQYVNRLNREQWIVMYCT